MAMKNPPRRTTIRGQKHLLAYITPDEAQLLMDNGGSGEPGPMGIPSFAKGGSGGSRGGRGGSRGGPGAGGPAGMGAGSMGGFGIGADSGPSAGGGYTVGDPGEMSAADAAQAAAVAAAVGDMGMTPGESQARYGTPAFAGRTTAPSAAEVAAVGPAPSTGGFDVAKAKAITDIMTAKNLGWVDRAILEAYAKGKNLRGFTKAPKSYKGVFSSFESEQSLPPGLLTAGLGMLGLPTSGWTTTGWGEGVMGEGPEFMGGSGREDVVEASYNPSTGQQDQCPEGYVFDEDLQACRMDVNLPMDYTAQPGVGPANGGLYGRMGLLDIAPTGLGMFQQRYNAGFGMPSEFDVTNRAFRQSGGVQRPYSGYALLS